MKAGLVTPYDIAVPGGVRTHIVGLGHELQHQGFEVAIIGPSSRPQATVDGLRFIRVGRPVAIPVAGSVARLAINPLLGFRVWKLLRRERFDLLHLHEPLVPMAPFWCLVIFGGPKVGTFHLARETPNALYRFGRWFLRPLIDRLGARIAVSESARATVALYLPGECAIIPNGVAEAAFIEHHSSGSSPMVLFVGRMERRKGVFEVVRAMADVQRERPGVSLVLIGDGPLLQAAVDEADRLDVGCDFRGRLPDAELRVLYGSADVFCAPSLENESFGIVVLEAMAAGLPIVASDLPGYRALLGDGGAGALVPPGDTRALALAIAELLGNSRHRIELGNAARERARQYAWPSLIGEVLHCYETASGRHEPAGASSGAAGWTSE